MPSPHDIERILSEDDWLRRIARRLATDSHAAEDMAQDAWVAALSARRADRSWLFGVLRNLRHESLRKKRRDGDARSQLTPRDDVPATDEVAEELLLRKRVTEGLFELEEPYRTALYLRFVQDQKLPAIARRTGVAVSTVHTRIAQGLARLRASLDADYDGNRKAWSLGLLSLAKPPGLVAGLSTTLTGGALVGASTKTAAATVVVAGALIWVWNEREVEPTPELGPSRPATSRAMAGTDLTAPVESPGEDRATVLAADSDQEPTLAPVEAAFPTVHGRVLTLDGRPLAAVPVGYAPGSTSAPSESSTTDSSGRFELPLTPAAGDTARGAFREQGPSIVCLEPGYRTLLDGVRSEEERLVIVGREVDFAGVVVDETGGPIAGARLRFDLGQSLFRELAIPRPFAADDPDHEAVSDELGRFRFDRLCGGDHVGLWVSADGFMSRTIDLPAAGDPALNVVLSAVDDKLTLTGIVYDDDGSPRPGASVSAGMKIVTTDADGRFELAWKRLHGYEEPDPADGVFYAPQDTGILRASYPGFLPAELAIDERLAAGDIELHLGPPALTIEGRVLDSSGNPRPDVVVWPTDLTPLGQLSQESGGSRAVWTLSIEEENGGGPGTAGARTDAEGRFVLDGMLERDYELLVQDANTMERGGPWDVAGGSTEVVLVLATDPHVERVAGRVVTASGAPFVDVLVRPRRQLVFNDGSQPPHGLNGSLSTRTDAEGKFEFEALATDGTVLELQHPSFFIRHFGLEGGEDLGELVIVQPALCELQVELRGDTEAADTLRILDGDGNALELLESFGAFLATADSARIEDGKSGVLRVLETAQTLVVLEGGVEILRRSLRLDPTERTLLQL